MDAVAPDFCLPRDRHGIGNWFNQELFGKPTDLPWGLKIDPQTPARGVLDHNTFHPTFLYELTYDP